MWDKEQEKQEKKNNDQTNETKHLVMEGGGWMNGVVKCTNNWEKWELKHNQIKRGWTNKRESKQNVMKKWGGLQSNKKMESLFVCFFLS